MKIKIVTLLLLITRLCYAQPAVIPSFTAPDTVCINTPVNIVNTSTGASRYYWNFCVAGINSIPSAVNIGNPGPASNLSRPVFSDIAEDNGNFYAFIVNHDPGGLTRLDFGNSMLNTPTATYLGNPSNVMNAHFGNEGIQVVKNEGKWYAIIVGGYPPNGSSPRLMKIEFGTNIANNSPVGTNWGNLGNMYEPIELHMFQENNIWYGFTVNAESNSITRFNFTNSFNNVPTAVNLGNIGGLDYPTGLYAINDNGNWRVFVANGRGNTLSRLDFGASLLNTPTGTNLGNPGNVLSQPRDFTILRLCDEIAGYAVNGTGDDIAFFNFHNDLLSVPSGASLGNLGNLNFPHSISKFFRVGNDIYFLITNVNNNTITRLQFTGCSNSNIASSTQQTPPTIVYNTPGVYHINLSVDDGLASQNSFCKQVVVVPGLVHTPLQKNLTCNTDSMKIGSGLKQVSYLWNTGETTDSIVVRASGTYWVQSSRAECSNRDSFSISLDKINTQLLNNDTALCEGNIVQLNAIGANSYSWAPSAGLSNPTIANPIAKPLVTTQYIVTGSSANGCIAKDTVNINVSAAPVILKTADTSICHDTQLQLNIAGGNTYSWLPDATLSNTGIPNPIASPLHNTTYYITVTGMNSCSKADSVKVSVKLPPVFKVSADTDACVGSPVQLNASGGDSYLWQPPVALSNPAIPNPKATPASSTIYTVKIIDNTCMDSATLTSTINVLPLPEVKASSSNDVDCNTPASQLLATGALSYVWTPALNLNNAGIANPIASPSGPVQYVVKGTGSNGCSNYDSVFVKVTTIGNLLFDLPNAFTPNHDGYNDCFGFSRYAGILKEVELSIYNRFGVKLFYSNNSQQCWDGSYKGKLQDPGGYVYILKAKSLCGNIFKKGVIMLIR